MSIAGTVVGGLTKSVDKQLPEEDGRRAGDEAQRDTTVARRRYKRLVDELVRDGA